MMWNGNEDEEGLKECFEKGEVIEGIRGEGSEFVGIQASNGRWLKEGDLWKERKEQIRETVESIEHTRREGGKGVGVKRMRERID